MDTSRGSLLFIPGHYRTWFDDNDLTFARRAKDRISQFLFPDHCRTRFDDNDLTSARRARSRKRRLFLRLTFGPNETVFILVNRHVTWKFPFSSGVPIGYCLLNCLVIGWFKCFQNLQVNLDTWGFTWSWPGIMWFRLCLVTCWRF